MSAFNTRGVKTRDMFVRTHVAFYFVSLLLGDILQGAFSVCTRGCGLRYAAWRRCMGYDLGCFPAAVERTSLVSDAVTDIPSLFFSNWIYYECSMGTRQGRCLRLAVYSTRQGMHVRS